jgi:HEAT repeat protein
MARKIKFNQLFGAFSRVSAAVDEFIQFANDAPVGSASAKKYFADARAPSGVILSLPTPIGDIVLLGQDDNIFNSQAALVVDLGGDDRYAGPVGTGASDTRPVSILIDISGNDTYANEKTRQGQGVGVASIGVVADLAGDDHYVAGDMSQGCGMFGVGLLLDAKGDDVYEMGLMGQGFGLFGVGLLMDLMGNDRYEINGMGQGVGSTMGFGGLIDSRGDDDYHAKWHPARSTLQPDDWSHAQGVGVSVRSPDWHRNFSLYGGIGFLSDGAGNDTYSCSASNCMGAGYFMSVGSLVDHSGNDRYYPENGNGMGFAVHLASGILIDREGNDQYFAKFDSGGVGADRSTGMLVDYQGNDTYGPALSADSEAKRERQRPPEINRAVLAKTSNAELAASSYASASRSKGLGILIDGSGDDRYFSKEGIRSASCGAVIPPPDPSNWSHAMLLDLGGADFHNSADRKNNSYRIDLSHGLFYDVDLPAGEKAIHDLPPVLVAGNQGGYPPLPMASISEKLEAELKALSGEDVFGRFASIGRVVQSDPKIIKAMIDALSISCHRDINQSLIEALNYFILRKEMNRERTRDFERLLNACDPVVRSYASRTLGWWNVAHSADAVVRAMNEADPQVREDVFWAVGRLGQIEVLKTLSEAIPAETSISAKRANLRAFHEILANNKLDEENKRKEALKSLLLWADDSDPIVRREAVAGLRYIGPQNEVIQILTDHLKDADIYVRRISAISLAYLGQKEGIPVLIDSLRFPSIDTSEYYDHDLIKDIAYFSGTDFPDEDRYDHKTWKNWWYQNGHKVDLSENLAIREKIETAFEENNEIEGLAILDRLLDQYPDNLVVKLRTVRFCNDWIVYRLQSRGTIDQNVLKRCLRLQKKIVEIEPKDTQAISTLARFYARLSRFIEAAAAINMAIRLEPENGQYHHYLKQYETAALTLRTQTDE